MWSWTKLLKKLISDMHTHMSTLYSIYFFNVTTIYAKAKNDTLI